MKKNPEISIIIPVFNREAFLNKCVDSILKQTFTNFELILVDDGSTDSSSEICKSYAKKDSRVLYFHQENKGVSAARNTGLDNAKGNYIGWVDSDDWIAIDMFEHLYNLIIKYDASISECGFYYVVNNNKYLHKFGDSITYGEGIFLLNSYINGSLFHGMCSKLFKREVFDEFRFPSGRIFEDTVLTLYISVSKLKFVRSPEPKYYYVQTNGSIITSDLTPLKARQGMHLYNLLFNSLDKWNNLNELENNSLKNYLKQNGVVWYLGLGLSNKPIIQKVYSIYFQKRHKMSILECLKSDKISLRNKFAFILHRYGLINIYLLIKKVLVLIGVTGNNNKKEVWLH